VTRPAYDPDEAQENAKAKAPHLALYAYRLGIAWQELGGLPYSDRTDRKAPTLRRFAAAAFRAAGITANVPHSRTSDTWDYVRTELAALEDRERYGFDPPDRDLLDQRARWIARPVHTIPIPDPGEPPDDMPADIPAELPARVTPPPRRARPLDLVVYDTPPALVTAGSPPLLPGQTIRAGPPRGWHELATLGPLNPARPCRWCGAPAIVGTLNGWRCSAHWPTRGDHRGDWGWNLNWAPNPAKPPCLAAACYCGRCPHYDPAGQALKRGARAGVGDSNTRSE
jgi:hypothetical protein